jgi:ABC-type multidrug transport system fused ATPase/permease subunit
MTNERARAPQTLSRVAGVLYALLDQRGRKLAAASIAALIGANAALTLSTGAFAAAIGKMAQGGEVSLWLATAAIGLGCGQVLDALKWRYHALAEQRLEAALSASLLVHFLAHPGTSQHSAVTVHMHSEAIQSARLIFQHLLATAPAAALGVLLASGLLMILSSPVLAAAMIAASGFYLAAATWRSEQLAPLGRAVLQARTRVAAQRADAIANCDIIRSFEAALFIEERAKRALRDLGRKSALLARLRAHTTIAGALAFACGYGGILAACLSAPGGRGSVALLALASMSFMALIRPLDLAAFAVRDLQQARAGATLLFDLKVKPNPAPMRASEPHWPLGVRLDAVSFAYESRGALFEDLDLILPPGAMMALTGDSGAGKSTLAKLMSGRLLASSGGVTFFSERGETPELAPGDIAFAPQETMLLDDSIEANIVFGRTASEVEVERVINLAGLRPLLARLPSGLRTKIGERGALLSGGERQRLSLARAFLKPARLYILDEVTSGLDAKSEARIFAKLREARAGATLIVIAHRGAGLRGMDTQFHLRA